MKSDLEYLLDAMGAGSLVCAEHLYAAIERRKQDLAQRNQLWDAKEVMQDAGKSNPTGNAQPGAAHPVDNTPKGGGDETMCWRCSTQYNRSDKACPECEAANANANPDLAMWQQGHDYDALLAERDAARAELREAQKIILEMRKVIGEHNGP